MYRYRDPPECGCALHSNGSAHYRVICVLSVVDQKVKRSRDKGPEKACSRSMQTWTHVHTHIHTPHTVYIPYHMPHTPHSTTYHHPRTWHSSPAPLLTLTPHSHHTHITLTTHQPILPLVIPAPVFNHFQPTYHSSRERDDQDALWDCSRPHRWEALATHYNQCVAKWAKIFALEILITEQ